MTSHLNVYSQPTFARSESPEALISRQSSSSKSVIEQAVQLPSSAHNQTASSANSRFTDDEKFELLSAFLDDEVSEEERQLVNHWLQSDPKVRQAYQQQQQIQAAFKFL